MYLKALTLRGFKSFASTTTLRLEPGITCVVGPNGSGKSNVVDALAWVMGEQGAKSLRGANMSDVIFAGTSARSPLGRAQVELTIDNSDGRLPIEFSEVTISRTLFRGGGSEYTINGSAVRLLDVQELLSDTGLGKQMHVIVGQGQLDAVLRSTPEERRGFIDEAAGVLKHRRRKERALRKLEAMDANLVRVLDLTEEIRRQLRPLERQAKAAREAAGVQERIDYAQSRLIADDLVTSQRRMERDQAELERAQGAAAGQGAQIGQLRDQVAAGQERGAALQTELQRYSELWHQFDSLQERLSSVVDLSAERLAQAQPRGQQISEAQIDLSADKAEETATEARRAEEEVARRRLAADRSAAERVEIDREVDRATRALREREGALERQRREAARIREARVSAASLVEAVRAGVQRAEEALTEATQRLTEVRREEPGYDGPDAEADPASPAQSLADRHAAAAAAEQEARRALDGLQAIERDTRADLASWRARRDALESSLPGRAAGPNHRGQTPGDSARSLGSLGQNLRVGRGWERALSALLVPFEQAPIVAGDHSLDDVIARAETSATALRAIVAEDDALEPVTEAPAAGAPAIDVAESLPATAAIAAPSGISAALGELLDGAWLAESVEEARRILAGGNARVVATRDGLVFTAHSVRGPGDDAVSTLEIRTQWEDAKAEAERAEAELERAALRVAQGRERLAEAAAQTSTALRLLREHDAEQATVAQVRARAAARIAAAEDERQRCEATLTAATQRLTAAEEGLVAAESELAKAPTPDAEAFLEEERRLADQASARSNQAREREMADKLALRTAEEQARSATRQADAFRTQAEQLRQTRIDQGRREEVLQALRQRIARTRAAAERARAEAADNVRVTRDRRQHLEEQIRQAQSVHLGLTRQLEDLQWKQNHADEARQQAEVALAGSRLLYQQHRDRALDLVRDRDRVGDEPDQDEALARLVAQYGPEQPDVDPEGNPGPYQRASMALRLDAAQRELARLGVVNPLAVEEHAALSARHEFLVEQVGDLKKSKADLISIIADVDERVRRAFQEAFEETRVQFERVFGILFPGGRGHLTLTEPDDPLATGVEIYARPAGKRVTRLSLLSGGERSLAALAYLIAIFQARPSPFYVMDEVEAALDDINLSRVLTVLEELRENSQLILVTHQKRTMEIADALYGVSMREGTTAVVSHRLTKDPA